MKKTKNRIKAAKRNKGAVKKGDKFTCSECGFSVTIDEPCDCMDCHELVCCDTPMACEMK